MARQFAIIIGVNQYRYYPQRPLCFAEHDAAAMEKYLKDIAFEWVARFSDRSPVLDNRPTLPERTNLLRALDALESYPLKRDDSVWFFFSGHGLESSWVVTVCLVDLFSRVRICGCVSSLASRLAECNR